MRVRISDPARLEELRSALRSAGVTAVQVEDDTLLVLYPLEVDAHEARLELAFFIKAWLASRPGVDADLAA